MSKKKEGAIKEHEGYCSSNCKENWHCINKFLKPTADKGKKDMIMVVDFDYTLNCHIETVVKSWIVDYDPSLYASLWKNMMQYFKYYNGKVRLENDKT